MESSAAAAAAVAAAVTAPPPTSGYPDSVDSSPRSRGAESWDEPLPNTNSNSNSNACSSSRLRLMCSYGGHIVPRPHDKTLCYLGGETRIVVVDRHVTLHDLHSRLSRSLLNGRPFTLKYQLPSEDLDSLISVTTDEDLDNMVEEYDRVVNISVNPKPRLRLFLFPAKAESAPASIGSLLDDSKSETWFVDALNGAIVAAALPRGLSADSAGSSVNCLLGLEDAAASAPPPPLPPPQPAPEAVHLYLNPPQQQQQNTQANRPDSPEKTKAPPAGGVATQQDVHSVPDSPMLDTASSFDSASSAPVLSNLPPIRVRPSEPDRGGGGGGGLEEQLTHMNVGAKQQEEIPPIHPSQPPPAQNTVAYSGGSAATPTVISPTENPSQQGGRSTAVSSDDEKPERKPPPQPPQPQQQKPFAAIEIPIAQRAYHPERNPSGFSGSTGSDGKPENTVAQQDPAYRAPPTQEPSYLIPVPPEKLQQQQALQQPTQQQHQQHQQHQQQQYIQPNPQLMQHHQAAPPVVPFPSFYQMQPQQHQLPQGYNQQIPMFFVPIQPNANYGIPNIGDPKTALPIPSSVLQSQGVVTSAPKPELVAGANVYRTSGSPSIAAQPLIHLGGDQGHQQFMGYQPHPMQHHPSQSVGYRYEFPSPGAAVQTPPLYYAQATSAPMPSHFQTASSAAATTVITDTPSQLQQQQVPADAKQQQARPSS